MATILQLNPIEGTATARPETPTPQAPVSSSPVLNAVRKALDDKADVTALTAMYLKLRAAKKDLDEQGKNRVRPLTEAMGLIETRFLELMLELKVDSLKNDAGTPYQSERVSITVADISAFMDFVLTRALEGLDVSDGAKEAIKRAMLDSGQLSLVDARASKSAVEELVAQTKELPPGLNRSVERTVNVRAS